MNPVETYLSELHTVHSSGVGVPETTYYTILREMLAAVGKTLKPKVLCIVHPKSQGAGLPDMGLFLQDQLNKDGSVDPLVQLPARGAVEVKSTALPRDQLVGEPQVAKYLAKYNQVLITNLREFALVLAGQGGKPRIAERYALAATEDEFWKQLAAHPRKAAAQHGDGLVEFLQRSLQRPAPITSAQVLAWFLASYAREAHRRVDAQPDLPELQSLSKALESALGMAFVGAEGQDFFRSTLVQTLFYGVFAAWVLWHKGNPQPGESFHWREAAWHLDVPAIQALFEQVSAAGKLKKLGLVEPLDWAGETLNRVDRNALFATFEEQHAVQYFYEPFLQAFDPVLRKELGVWYTPAEVIQYMVARVDTVLRTELNVPDGLADERVVILDACCGTGGYLVEVLARIAGVLEESGDAALVAYKLKQAAKERVLGFEILPAPFVIAHLQLGLLLAGLDLPDGLRKQWAYDFAENERIGVYLTNTLEGPHEHTNLPLFTQFLARETDAANRVKQDLPVLAIFGNPPYSGHSSNQGKWIVDLLRGRLPDGGKTASYYEVDGQPLGERNPKWLQDDYVKFIRWAQCRIERTGSGILGFITNHSYLDNPTFRGMRRALMQSFTDIYVLDLHGNAKKREVARDGGKDENVFDIQQGVAIGIFVKESGKAGPARVHHAELWGGRAAKYGQLLADDVQTAPWQALKPQGPFYLVVPHSGGPIDRLSARVESHGRFSRQRSWISDSSRPLRA